MEKREKNRMIWIVILSLVVFLLIGYVVYDFMLKGGLDFPILKGDKEEKYVKDAEYSFPVSKNSYTTVWGDVYRVEQYKAPYISFDSEDARIANREIKDLFEKIMGVFEMGIQDGISYIKTFRYKTYLNDHIVSLVLETSYTEMGTSVNRNYTYNFDVTTGKKVNYKTVYSEAGYDESTIYDKAIESIDRAFIRWYQENNIEENEEYHQQLKEETFRSYDADVANQSLGYYLDSNKKLNILFQLWVPIDSGIIQIQTIVE